MDKYYTPEISDLYLGYECEVDKNIYADKNPDWEAIVASENNMGDEGLLAKCRTGKVRTPYLTREQIENEGWFAGHPTAFSKGNHVLMLYDNKKIEIRHMGSPSYTVDTSYLGSCPSINEFRKIMKLLGI